MLDEKMDGQLSIKSNQIENNLARKKEKLERTDVKSQDGTPKI